MPREGREHAAEPGKAKSLSPHRAPAITREREAMVFQGTKAAPSVLSRRVSDAAANSEYRTGRARWRLHARRRRGIAHGSPLRFAERSMRGFALDEECEAGIERLGTH
jgi:hypothetical protein